MVERADLVSRDFAKQFKEKLEDKKNDKQSCSGRLSLVVQADFAYLMKLAQGRCVLPTDKMRQRLVLPGLKAALGSYLRQLDQNET